MLQSLHRLAEYDEVHAAIVMLIWPLLKRLNWTYRDQFAVVRTILPSHHRYPLETETELATYCQNVLGLRKSGPKGRSSPGGKPPGWQVTVKLCGRAAGSS